jgi:uncharacterized protein YbjT (DUF2867 family)
MNVLLFGATGMVGQGVLRECLLAADVERVQTIGRSATGQRHAKLHEVVQADLFDYSGIEDELAGFDACFFCLGISSAGLDEPTYTHLTYDIALAAATVLARLNPKMTFVYVSGAGTDSSEKGRAMWARVKGRTENALLRLPFRRAYMFRPGVIQPLHGIKSKTSSYRVLYTLMRPLLPVLRRLWPRQIASTQSVARAMLSVARHGYARAVLETGDIAAAALL